MTAKVDLSKLKVGDKVRLRDDRRWYEVTHVEVAAEEPYGAIYYISTDFEEDYTSGYFEDGTWASSTRPQSYMDIVELQCSPVDAEGGTPEAGMPQASGDERSEASSHVVDADAGGGTTEALRFNEGKPRMGYLPLDLLDGAAEVMAYGAQKYSVGNYRKGYKDLQSPLSSLIRHVASLQRAIEEEDVEGFKGHLYDAESGQAHVHHVITSALLLIHSMRLKDYNI